MASEILGLFTSPEDYQMRQRQAAQNRAFQFAQLDPFEKASYSAYQGGRALGDFGGRLLGGEDPQLRKITMRQQMLTGAGGGPRINLNDPGSMLRAANVAQEQGDPEFAQYLINASNDLAKNMAEMRSKSATAARTELTIAQEEKLRDELAKLSPEATEKDLLAVVSKYGDPTKIMALLQSSQMAQATREARKEEKQLTLDQQKSIEQEKLQAKKESEERKIEADRQAALLAATTKKEIAAANNKAAAQTKALIEASKPPKTLSANLQKEETANLENIDKYEAQIKALEGPIKNLIPDSKTGKPFLDLGIGKNAWNTLINTLGASEPKSRAYEELQSAIDTAVNLQVSAEKGVQTDKDVIRFRDALVAARGRNDTKATLQALIRFKNAIETAKEKTQKIIEGRRKSQGVDPYYSSGGSKVIDFSDIGR